MHGNIAGNVTPLAKEAFSQWGHNSNGEDIIMVFFNGTEEGATDAIAPLLRGGGITRDATVWTPPSGRGCGPVDAQGCNSMGHNLCA